MKNGLVFPEKKNSRNKLLFHMKNYRNKSWQHSRHVLRVFAKSLFQVPRVQQTFWKSCKLSTFVFLRKNKYQFYKYIISFDIVWKRIPNYMAMSYFKFEIKIILNIRSTDICFSLIMFLHIEYYVSYFLTWDDMKGLMETMKLLPQFFLVNNDKHDSFNVVRCPTDEKADNNSH